MSVVRPNKRSMAVVALLCLGLPCLGAACDDPDLHPELAEFAALQETLRAQPRATVEVKYKVAEDIRVLGDSWVRLWFWPNEAYDAGILTVIPSPGLQLRDGFSTAEIPYKGMLEIPVRAMRAGHHYLQVVTTVDKGAETISRTVALAVPVEMDHAAAGGSAFGFAGPKLRSALSGSQSDAENSQDD